MTTRRAARTIGVLVAAVAVVACGGESARSALAKHLIPVAAFENAQWKLHLQKPRNGAFGVVSKAEQGAVPSGSPPTTLILGRARAVVTRQWASGAPTHSGPLPDGIFTVIDIAAVFGSPADAHAFAQSLASGSDLLPRPPANDEGAGASYYSRPFGQVVPGGEPEGRTDIVVIERGDYVFIVQLTGGGSRPTPLDAGIAADLQASVAPTAPSR